MFRDWLAVFDSGRQKLACAVWLGVGVCAVSALAIPSAMRECLLFKGPNCASYFSCCRDQIPYKE